MLGFLKCRRMRLEFTGYVTGDIDPEEAEHVRAHVAECTRCRQELEEFREIIEALRALRYKDPDWDWNWILAEAKRRYLEQPTPTLDPMTYPPDVQPRDGPGMRS